MAAITFTTVFETFIESLYSIYRIVYISESALLKCFLKMFLFDYIMPLKWSALFTNTDEAVIVLSWKSFAWYAGSSPFTTTLPHHPQSPSALPPEFWGVWLSVGCSYSQGPASQVEARWAAKSRYLTYSFCLYGSGLDWAGRILLWVATAQGTCCSTYSLGDSVWEKVNTGRPVGKTVLWLASGALDFVRVSAIPQTDMGGWVYLKFYISSGLCLTCAFFPGVWNLGDCPWRQRLSLGAAPDTNSGHWVSDKVPWLAPFHTCLPNMVPGEMCTSWVTRSLWLVSPGLHPCAFSLCCLYFASFCCNKS